MATKSQNAKVDDEAKPDEKGKLAEKQFPSLSGAKRVEIAERSGDFEGTESNVFVKHFHVMAKDWSLPGGKFVIHERNIGAARQAAINQGLHPTGDGNFEGVLEESPADTVTLVYHVPVTPAATAHNDHVTVQQGQEVPDA